MRILHLLIGLIFLTIPLHGQTDSSLRQLKVLLKEEMDDSIQVRLMTEIALLYKVSDTTVAFEYLDRAARLSHSSPYELGTGIVAEARGEILMYHGLYMKAIGQFDTAASLYDNEDEDVLLAGVVVDEGNANLFLSKYDTALIKYEQALEIFRKHEHIPGMSRCLNNMGIVYKNFGQYEKALERYEQVTDLYLQIGDSASLTDTYINTGVVNVLRGNYHLAIENFTKALFYAHETGNMKDEASTLLNIGVIHNKMGNYDKALEYYKEALEVGRKLDDKMEISKALTNIGTNYSSMGKYSLAESYIRRGLEIKNELGDIRSISNCYNYLAEIHLQQEEYSRALDLNKQSIRLKREVNDQEGLARCFKGLSRTFMEMGEENVAYAYADSALELSLPMGVLEHIVDAYGIQKEIMARQGNYRRAYQLSELHKNYSDSLMNENNTQAVNEIEFRYQSQMLEEENNRLKIQAQMDALLLSRHTKIFISVTAAIIMFALALILMFTLHRREKHYNRALRKKNQIITKQNMQLEILNQTKDKILSVVSHDLRGTIGNQLTALSVLARGDFMDEEERKLVFSRLTNSATLSLEILENLAHWINLKEGKIEYMPEQGNLGHSIRDVIDYFRESVTNKELDFVIDVNKELPCVYDELMIKSAIKNLLSNAIKFSERRGEIRVITGIEGDCVKVSVSDRGIGMTEGEISRLLKGDISKFRRGTENEKGSGLGLSIAQAFLKHHGSKLNIKSLLKEGTTISFSLNCKETVKS